MRKTTNSFFLLLFGIACVSFVIYAVDLFSRDSRGHTDAGDRFLHQERYRDAISSYRKAVRLDRGNPRAWANLAYAYFRLKEYKRSSAAYERASGLSRDNADLTLSAAVGYELAGLMNEADAAFKRASESSGGDPKTLFERIKFCFRQKRYREAEFLARDAQNRFRSYADPSLFLAILKMRVNRFQEAYELCKTALALDPQNEKAKELLSALERIRNRPAQDRWFHSEDEDAKFSRAMSSLMRENVTLERQ